MASRTEVTTKPINLRDYQVRAALDGRLRLIVVPVVPQPEESFATDYNRDGSIKARRSYGWTWRPYRDAGSLTVAGHAMLDHCPIGAPGTVLWGRETWAHDAESVGACRAAYESLGAVAPLYYGPYYRVGEVAPETFRWRSSATMPRWASRITLTVESVDVRRVQSTCKDMHLAGIPECPKCADSPWGRGAIDDPLSSAAGGRPFAECDGPCEGKMAGAWFRDHWNDRYAKKGMPFDGNCWAWFVGVKSKEDR